MYVRNYPECRYCGDFIWYLYLDNHEKHCEEKPMAFGMDVDAVFAFHPATKVTGPKHDEIREKFRVLAHWVENNVPASAEQTLAIRKLQEGMMFSNAAVAIHTPVDYEETPQVNPHSGATWEPGGGPISQDQAEDLFPDGKPLSDDDKKSLRDDDPGE